MIAYFRVDLLRGFRSYKVMLSILMVVGILLVGTLEGISTDVSVYYIFRIVMIGASIIAILAAGAFAYGDSLHEDMEKKYAMQQILRKGWRGYCLSKVTSIFFFAVLSVTLGIVLYTLVLRMGVPWITSWELEPGGRYALDVMGTRFTWALEQQNFPLFFLLYGFQYGILAGNVAVIASLVGLWIPNRMLIFASPMILYYFLDLWIHATTTRVMGIASIFDGFVDYFNHDLLSVGVTLLLSVGVLGATSMVMCARLKRRGL